MTEYRIRLKSVYSKPASNLPAEITLPSGWSSLSWHQVETFNALSDPGLDVIFNTAMTGDGKSLAGYLKAMMGLNPTIAMYPTNELARDQERQVQSYKAQFNPKYDPQIYRLTRATLEDFIETNQLPSKQQGIINRINNSEILLTNPDIFHYIHDFRYLQRGVKQGDNADKLFRKLDECYKIFIFDEFHVFSSPQMASILNAMLLIKHTATKRKFLFLSATPSQLFKDLLQRSGFIYRIIDPIKENAYRFSESEAIGWRLISQPITMKFPRQLQPNARSSYDWIIENSESVILKFFLDNPGSKGAIILNSIASAYKSVAKLQPLFQEYNLVVLPNTSLTGESERARSILDADLLIGTSTIDIGVDFRINFLIFEASDVGNFIQRFGRLGRHPGFSKYEAYALIPNFLVARLFEGRGDQQSPALVDEMEYDRVTFTQAIKDNWSFVNQFEYYPQRWGSVQSVCMHMELRKAHMITIYPEAQQGFRVDVENTFQVKLSQKYAQVNSLIKQKQQKIINEARSFREGSQLDCAVYDLTNPNEPERDRFKTYHLPGLLSNFVFEVVRKEEFLEKVKEAQLPTRRFEKALCHLYLKDYREVRENWYFLYTGNNFMQIKQLGRVQILKGLEVTGGPNAISRSLSQRGMVCFISDRDRAYLKTRLGLPMHFQAYGLSDRWDDPNPPYTIAFGKAALMLESLIWYWKPKEREAWIL
ncbi:type I-D CRISPR-associated helicase Cas3' [Trichothermofontia sp.]